MIFEQEAKVYKDDAIRDALDDVLASATQYNWHTETDTGAGAGTHITAIPKDDFLADPDNGGYNSLFDNIGMKIRNGLRTLASYGVSMVIGGDDSARVEVDSDTIRAITEEGVEAFSVESSSQALAQFVTKQVSEIVQANSQSTLTFDNLTNAVSSQLVQLTCFYQYIPQGKTYSVGKEATADFIKGTSSTEQITFTDYISGTATTVTITVAYDGANSFTVTNGSRYYASAKKIGYYEQNVPIPETKFNGLFKLNGVNFEQPTLDNTTLTPYSSRCNIRDGGIFRFGKWRFIQVNVEILSSLGANNTWAIIDGLASDLPVTQGMLSDASMGYMTSLSACVRGNYGNISAFITNDGRIAIATAGQSLGYNSVVMISGMYIAQ